MIDLKAQYGKRYRVTLDESWDVEINKKTEDRIWYDEIWGRRGWCYIQNPTTLALEIRSSMWPKFERNPPFPYVLKRFGESTKVLVDEKYVDKAIHFIIPRRKRQLTDEQKAVNSARLAKFRFRSVA